MPACAGIIEAIYRRGNTAEMGRATGWKRLVNHSLRSKRRSLHTNYRAQDFGCTGLERLDSDTERACEGRKPCQRRVAPLAQAFRCGPCVQVFAPRAWRAH